MLQIADAGNVVNWIDLPGSHELQCPNDILSRAAAGAGDDADNVVKSRNIISLFGQ
jgi:hypothetical protein